MTSLVVVLAWSVGWWNIGAALPRSILRKSNSIALANTSFSLILLLRRAIPDVCSQWTVLSFGHHRSFGLRSPCLIISFAALGISINIIIVLLS
jgi:hypothetical protein